MFEIMLELWHTVVDGLEILWNMVISLCDRQIAILLVVGTFAVALVAAFQDRIRSRLFGPRLSLAGGPDYSPDEGPVPLVDTNGNKICDGCFVGLPIRNDGPAPATDIEVLVSELERYHNDTFESDRRFYPLPLYWRHYVPKRVFLDRLLPGSLRHIGLGYIPSELKSIGPGFEQLNLQQGKLPFVIDSPMRPTTRSYIIHPGRYRLTLEITAANSRKPVKTVIELSFGGDWCADNTKGMITINRVGNS